MPFRGSSNGAARKNVLPFPNSLVQPIRPPINSTKPLLMANPRPVPPYLRVVEESACVKRSKIISDFVGGDPDSGIDDVESQPARALLRCDPVSRRAA